METSDTNVMETVPLTCLFDPNSKPEVLIECLDQYSNRISTIRVLIGHNERYEIGSTRQTILLARRYNIPTVTRVESPKVVITRGILPIYLDLCAETGVDRIQFRKESLQPDIKPREVVALADDRNLDVQFEIDETTSTYPINGQAAKAIIDETMNWLNAGAVNVAAGLTDHIAGSNDVHNAPIDRVFAELLASAFGLHTVMFKAPWRDAQEALIHYFGEDAHICDVPFPDVTNVEKLRSELGTSSALMAERQLAVVPENRWSNRKALQRNR